MPRRSLSVGELAVHFGLEPVEVEWLLERCAAGMSWPELIKEIQTLECTRAEAERLAAYLRERAAPYDASPVRTDRG